MPKDWQAVIERAHADNEKHGVNIKGRKYSQVAQRVERFRLEFGAWGIETNIVSFSAKRGEPVVVRAFITDEQSRIIASGHAFEIVGDGNVNSTAALENAETSAIGRALAALGLHGGEFASVNEIDGVDRKGGEAKAAIERHEKEVERELVKIATIDSIDELQSYWVALYKARRPIADDVRVVAAKDELKAALAEKEEA